MYEKMYFSFSLEKAMFSTQWLNSKLNAFECSRRYPQTGFIFCPPQAIDTSIHFLITKGPKIFRQYSLNRNENKISHQFFLNKNNILDNHPQFFFVFEIIKTF